MTWQPIATAYPAEGKTKPRGGKRILVWYHHYDHHDRYPDEYEQVGIAVWIESNGPRGGDYYCDGPDIILMWQPLPDPPKADLTAEVKQFVEHQRAEAAKPSGYM